MQWLAGAFFGCSWADVTLAPTRVDVRWPETRPAAPDCHCTESDGTCCRHGNGRLSWGLQRAASEIWRPVCPRARRLCTNDHYRQLPGNREMREKLSRPGCPQGSVAVAATSRDNDNNNNSNNSNKSNCGVPMLKRQLFGEPAELTNERNWTEMNSTRSGQLAASHLGRACAAEATLRRAKFSTTRET